MSSAFFHAELALYTRFYSHERGKAQSGFDLLDTLIKKIDMKAATNHNHSALQKYMRIVSTFCHIAEKFNDKIEALLAAIDTETFNQIVDVSPVAAEKLRIHDWLHADLMPYKEGGTFRGCVSFIPDVGQNICFVKDVTKPSGINFREFVEAELDGTPDMSYIFAVEIQEMIFRAVRLNVEPMNTATRVRLIDVGETVTISPSTIKYRLNGHAQRLYPQAILCQVQKINGSIVDSLDTIGMKQHYDIKVREITRYMLEVDMYLVADNDFFGAEDESLYHCIIGDNFENPANDILARMLSPASISNGNSCNGSTSPSPLKENGAVEQCEPPMPNGPAPKMAPPIPPRSRPPPPPPSKITIPVRIVSSANRAKPPSPGHISTNPFDLNGAHPKYPKLSNNVGIPSPPRPERSIPSYRVGDMLMVNPTHVAATDQLFVQIKPNDEDCMEFATRLASVGHTLIPKPSPAQSDLVIARYAVDGILYRARVIDMVDCDTYTVFYVDYGNTDHVKSDDIFEWHPVCETLPFLAVQCFLPHMRQLGNVHDPQLVKTVAECIVNRECKAVIKYVNNDDTLNIDLVMDNGHDVFDEVFNKKVDACGVASVV